MHRTAVPVEPLHDVRQSRRTYLPARARRGREAPAGRTVQAPRTLQRLDGGSRQRHPVLTATFMRSAGIRHSAACRSISFQVAPRASPDRTAVSTVNRRHAFTASLAEDASMASSAAPTSEYGSAAWCFFAFRAAGNAAPMPSATLNSRCSRATPHASAARIHPCSFDPVARFSAMTGARMAITSARRIWSRRRSRMEPQYRSRARRRFSGPRPFQSAAASTRSHAARNVGTRDGCTAFVGSPPGARPDDWRTLQHARRRARRAGTPRARGRGACLRPSAAAPNGGSGRRVQRPGRAYRRRRDVLAARPGSVWL